MAVNLSIKNVPDELAAKLRERAERNHRSLQGELMALIEGAVTMPLAGEYFAGQPGVDLPGAIRRGTKTVEEVAAEIRKLFPKPTPTPPGMSSVEIIRRMRDGRDGDQWRDPEHHDKGF